MREWAVRLAGRLLNRVRVNHVSVGAHNGTAVIIKRRRAGAGAVIWCANQYLRRARSGSHLIADAAAWAEWERECVRLLYPDVPGVIVTADRAVMLPMSPGRSLRSWLQGNDPDAVTAFVLAGSELRRAHRRRCDYFDGPWSHGDLHLDNVVCDPASGRAAVIDFDLRHDADREAGWRHADDVKLVLLELLGSSAGRWCEAATAFVAAYGDQVVLAALADQLVVPNGVARLLWYTRTGGAPLHQMTSRLQTLRERGVLPPT